MGRFYSHACIHLNYLTALYYLFMYSVIHLTHPISGVCCFWDSVCASRNIGVTALFAGTLVVFPLKQETFLILRAMQGLKSNLYSISLLLSTTAATNQFIVSASQNGCWSCNKQ